jgi:cysteine synthase
MIRKHDSLLDLMREVTLVRLKPRIAGRSGAELWAQLEMSLPGAMKDRVALKMIEDAEASGALRPGATIVESSSGTMGEGLARVGALKGYRVIIVTDLRLDANIKAKMKALGCQVEIVTEYDAVGGWQTARLRRLGEVIAATPGAVWMRQYDSSSNPAAYAEVARQVSDALPKLQALVVPVGSGGSLGGMAKALRALRPDIYTVAVDAAGSVIFNQPNRPRLQSGNGNSLIPGNVAFPLIDEVHWVSDGEAFAGCRELASVNGIFAGGSSGAAFVVASWVAERFPSDAQVVVTFPDRGDRYVETVYSDDYLAQHGLVGQVAAAEPRAIRYGVDEADEWSYAPLPHDGSVPYHSPGVARSLAVAEAFGLTTTGVV